MLVVAPLAALLVLPAGVTSSAAIGGERQPGTLLDRSYIVTLGPAEPGDPAGVAGGLVEKYGGELTAVYAHALRGFSLRATSDVADALRRDPSVATVEPDSVTTAGAEQSASAPQVRPDASASTIAPSGAVSGRVRLFVVDTGIRFDHEDLVGRAEFGFDAVGDGRNGADCNGHGTAMAGVAGGARAGIAPEATLVSVRVLGCDGRGSLSQLLAGFDWIAGQAPALGRSVVMLGTDGVAGPGIDAAVDSLLEKGIPVIVGAGDVGGDACERSPGRVPGVLSVGAIDGDGVRASFSDTGQCVDLFARGVGVVTDDIAGPTATTSSSGTAIAAASVAGVAARIVGAGVTSPGAVAGAIIEHARAGAVIDAGAGSPNRLLDPGVPSTTVPSTTVPSTTVPSTTVPSTTVPSTTVPSTTVPSTTVPSTTVPSTTVPSTTVPSTTVPSTTVPDHGPSAQSPPAGEGTDVFVRGLDGALWWRQLTQSGLSSWQSFGGQIVGDPVATTGPGGAVYVFARGTDGALWWQGYGGSRWSGWMSFGGYLTSDPTVYADSNGVWLAVRGGDTAMYFGRISPAGSWSGWLHGNGVLASRPSLSGDANGVYAFVIGGDQAVWAERISASAPSGFSSLGGAATLNPIAASDATGASVYVRGTDGGAYRSRVLGSGSFAPWQPLGGVITTSPTAVGSGSTTRVFARGLDGALYTQPIVNGISQGWQGLGGVVTSTPAAAIDANGSTIFVRSSDAQLWGQRFEGSWLGWGQMGGVPVASDPYAISAPVIDAAPPPPSTGFGFDACEAPTTSQMAAWRLGSPYTSVGIYIGGENRACSNSALNSSAWTSAVVGQGWRLIPIYVGLQAPCISFTSSQITRDPAGAASQGSISAQDAANRAANAGIPPGGAIYFDMEGYNNSDLGCVNAVRSFVSAWAAQLHARGYKAGMYSSLCSGIIDQATVYNNPSFNRLDAIWFAAWPYNDGNDPRYLSYDPQLFGTSGCGAPLTDGMWPFHQRIRQYRQGHNETYNGVTINIDTNKVDGPLAP